MKTLNVAKTCGIVGTILTFLFVLVLTASCNSGTDSVPEPRYDPGRTLPKYLEIVNSVSGLRDETVLVKTHIYDMGTGKENAEWKRTGNGTSEIAIKEPEEGQVYTIIAEVQGYTVRPESYKVRVIDDKAYFVSNGETGEDVSQLDFQFTPENPPTHTPAPSLTNLEPIEVISVSGPLQPINPGGPIVEITLKNASDEPVVSLTASLELSRSFTFNFDVNPTNPLLPGKSTSSRLTLIGGGFNDAISYPLVINGTLQSGEAFSYTKQVQIVAP